MDLKNEKFFGPKEKKSARTPMDTGSQPLLNASLSAPPKSSKIFIATLLKGVGFSGSNRNQIVQRDLGELEPVDLQASGSPASILDGGREGGPE